MLPITADQLFVHKDEDGTEYGFRYLTMRNQSNFYELVKSRTIAMKEVDKVIKNGYDEITDDLALSIRDSGNELIDMFLVSVNGTAYKKPSEEFFQDQPVNYMAYVVGLIFSLLPELQGGGQEDLKNSLRRHSSVSNQTDSSIGVNIVPESQKSVEDA